MKLNILILTHNRPILFKRCLTSVLNNLPEYVNIIVNNDSCDIEEVHHKQIEYFYYSSKNLSNVYKFLFDKIKENDHIMFLEDDDYIVKNFYNNLQYNHTSPDLTYMNFVPVNLNEYQRNDFKIETVNNLFQLSQMVFKKSCCTTFPVDNDIHNDWVLFQNVLENAKTIETIKTPMFIQTVDGKDNISFKEYNKDERFNS